MPERVSIGRTELGREVDVAAKFKHTIIVAVEDRLALVRGEREPLEILRLVRLERLAILLLHQRHAEHVDAVPLPRALRVKHEGAGNIVVIMRCAGHRLISDAAGPADIYNATADGNV